MNISTQKLIDRSVKSMHALERLAKSSHRGCRAARAALASADRAGLDRAKGYLVKPDGGLFGFFGGEFTVLK